MQRTSGQIEVKICAGAVLRLRDARGCAVQVAAGRVWITEEIDSRDLLLTAEMQYQIAHDGLTLLQAFRESRLIINPPQSAGRRLELGAAGSSPEIRALAVEVTA